MVRDPSWTDSLRRATAESQRDGPDRSTEPAGAASGRGPEPLTKVEARLMAGSAPGQAIRDGLRSEFFWTTLPAGDVSRERAGRMAGPCMVHGLHGIPPDVVKGGSPPKGETPC